MGTEDADLLKNYSRHLIDDLGLDEHTANARRSYITSFLRKCPGPVSCLDVNAAKAIFSAWRMQYRPNTFNLMISETRRFLVWLGWNKSDLVVPRERANKMTKTAAMMLTPEEVQRMIDAAWTSRNRAIVSVLYESGMRPVELVRLTWGEVKFDAYGAVINTSEKTGVPRYIRIIASAPHLARWKADYPTPIHADSRVFLRSREWRGKKFTPITHATIVRVVADCAARVGIKKHVFPYLFRHTHVTHQLEAQIPDSLIKLQHWGSLSTNMLATYGHVSNRFMDEVLLEKAGINPAPQREKRDLLKPVQCPACNTINPPGASICYVCAITLSEEAKTTREMMWKSILENPQELINLLEDLKKGKIN